MDPTAATTPRLKSLLNSNSLLPLAADRHSDHRAPGGVW
jgi:hypothetical protein